MRRLIFSMSILVIAVAAATVRGALAATFVSPTQNQPAGNVAPFVTTANVAQTKYGGLTFANNALTIGTDLTIGGVGGPNTLCWNDDGTGSGCKRRWSEISSLEHVLHLQPPVASDTGYVVFNGTSGAEASLTTTAGAPSSLIPTIGTSAIASPDLAGNSAAVVGVATVNSPTRVAVYGRSSNDNAAAGYFYGDVVVTPGMGTRYTDLVIGNSTANSNGVGEICLGGTCRSDWPNLAHSPWWGVGSSFIRLDPALVAARRSVSVAGTGSNPPVAINVPSAGIADLAVKGNASTEQLVVGTPPAGASGLTCGDGVCSSSISETVGSCAVDCDNTPPDDVSIFDVELAFCRSQSGRCPQLPWTAYLAWTWGASTDYKGVRIIVRTDRFPTGPNDASVGPVPGGDILKQGGSFQVYSAPCESRRSYYSAIYAYDAASNFSPGVLSLMICTNQDVRYLFPA